MKSSTITKPFVGIDGEGITVGRNHYYNLITARCSDLDKTIVFPAMEDNLRLTTWEILNFFRKRLSEFKKHKAIFVAFSFDYDVTKWLQDLTHEELSELYHTTQVLVTSPEGFNYHIKYFRRKFFTIEFIYKDSVGKLKTASITIYDVFSFFGTSFVKALEQWGFKVPEFLREMKDARGDFSQKDMQTIIDYNATECELLCQLMNKVRIALESEGLYLTKWHGSGAVAQKLLEITNSKSKISIPEITQNPDIEEALMGSYFGGRFELFRKGIIKETYQYDINSAYPYAMSTLPDLSNCNVYFSPTYTTDKYSIWYVQYNVLDHGGKRKKYTYVGAETFLPGPFPYRTKTGTILYPYFNMEGIWIHQVELENAIRLYGIECFKILYGYVIQPNSQRRAFPFIPELAAKRLILKSQGDERNIILKLALNSLYGKTAQGQRQVGVIPPFQNYYIAGYITAFTRATLLRQSFYCGEFGSANIQFATDGIFSRLPNNHIKRGDTSFGGWEATHIPVPICYIQGGIYYSTHTAKINKRRTRGFNASALEAEDVFNEWRKFIRSGGKSNPFISARENRFYGIGTTLATGNWSRFGKFISNERKLSFYTPSKQFANPIGEFLVGMDAWNYMAPKIRGITRGEIISAKDYVIQIPDSDLVEGASKLYEPINLKDTSNVPEHIMQLLIENIQAGEQPDYYDDEILDIEL